MTKETFENTTTIDTKSTDYNKLETQSKMDTLERKASHLRVILERDYKSADLKWSLFVASSQSFRYDSCLKPFPPSFVRNGNKDIDSLIHTISEIPSLDLVLRKLDNVEKLAEIVDIIDLLFYVLVRLREPYLKTIAPEEHENILKKVASTAPAAKPQYIFQVVSTNKSQAENKWATLAKNQRTFYAYHGSRLENFHSILHYGLQQHMSKNMLFGSGIYLSNELSVSLPYSHCGFAWGASCLGYNLSCVAMCELIDAQEGINYRKHTLQESQGDSILDQEHIEGIKSSDSIVSDVPPAYFVVTNNELVRVRYLLVYAKQEAQFSMSTTSVSRNEETGLRHWLYRHKFLSILLGYGLMLASIGFANHQPVQFYYRLLLKKIDLAISSIKV